ncbi:peptidase M28, partial [Flavobacterium sp. LBUM151]
MKKTLLYFVFTFLSFTQISISQVTEDPEIKKMITEIKADNLEATVQKLVSFGTRHTLSDTKSKTKGIGAAQQWVKSEFDKYALASNGRLTSVI